MKFDRSLFVKTAETQVSEDGTLFVYVDEETLESTGRVLINSKTSSGGALFYADGTPQQWTPVSEGLPKITEHHVSEVVICYLANEAYCFGSLEENPFGQTRWSCERDDEYHQPVGKVVAWMPLPEPYKGGDPE